MPAFCGSGGLRFVPFNRKGVQPFVEGELGMARVSLRIGDAGQSFSEDAGTFTLATVAGGVLVRLRAAMTLEAGVGFTRIPIITELPSNIVQVHAGIAFAF